MNAAELRSFLAHKFNETELRTLVFDLRIPFEDLGGAEIGLEGRIQALIEWCVRRDRLDELSRAAGEARTAVSAHPYALPVAAMNNEWGPAGIERMVRHMDELREDVAELVTKVELQNQRLAMLEKHLDHIIEHPQQVTWQTWAVAIIGLMMAIALLYAVGQLLLGGH
jgi:hypothetical protein